MVITKRPYIIIPKLIEQQTWGGNYILDLKKWRRLTFLKNKKIGQSYELFSGSKLLLNIHNTDDIRFVPELGSAEIDASITENFSLCENKDFINLSSLINYSPARVLGNRAIHFFGKMPLLIKFTQAIGNSFQIHIKPGTNHPRWQAKAESWLYLEDGFLTYGIRSGININNYKKVCFEIYKKMRQLSTAVKDKQKKLEAANQEAKKYINRLDPWQFVNLHHIKKNTVVDLSLGGVHHSWEEDQKQYPLGNVLYEIQQDVMDPVSTIRSFDKGKLKNDGEIREVNIDDYFQLLDTDRENNIIDNVIQKPIGQRRLTTKIYCLDVLEVKERLLQQTNNSFNHLFVFRGAVDVCAGGGIIHLDQGHSCFIPQDVGDYELKSNIKKSTVLKTFLAI